MISQLLLYSLDHLVYQSEFQSVSLESQPL